MKTQDMKTQDARSRAWVYGDRIDTDSLAPGYTLALPLPEAAAHCLEAVDPRFAAEVRPGDVFVAGRSLGLGSSREQAPAALKHLGIAAVLAKSYARIFYRNAFNIGLPALIFPQADEISMGDEVEIDSAFRQVKNLSTGKVYDLPPLPGHLGALIRDGGLIEHLKKRLRGGRP